MAFVLGTTSGGTGRHVRTLVEGLVRRGHQVLVAGPESVEEQFGFVGAGARFVAVAVSDRPHPGRDLRAMLAIRRLTRGADVVHAHGLRAGALAALGRAGGVSAALGMKGVVQAALRMWGAVRAVLGMRGAVGAAGGGSRVGGGRVLVVTLHNALTAGGFVGVVYGVLERIVARGADHVLVVSPDLGERMLALGAREVTAAVVGAPVLPPAKRTPQEVRDELAAGERPLLLTIARLAQQKGLETLLDVAAGPWEGHAEPLFVVAGEGPLRGALQARIAAEGLPVRLLGNRDDIPDLLGAAQALVMPSRWEGQPLTLREALMAGTPAIATEVGGIPEILGDAGILVRYGDVEGLRGAVRELLVTPGAAETLAAAAARRGREMPGDDDVVESALAAYPREDPRDE
ncbi:glycosyltransferase family 4 protein [Nonomuraea jiangxiensis]|uniref:glycosyltransferase family 4 protein n=1 Tax=Nonomuraea jiangxiensis TaxID=633440 RepID=UPI001FE75D59|nr:glycosyltransferase family 4 protein [Nonomuraea jiangxiensis]